MQLPSGIRRAYALFSGFFAILGLSSLVEGWVAWVGFFKSIVALYQYYIRDSLSLLIEWIRPNFIPPPPDALLDLVIIWTAAFAILRLFVTFESRTDVVFGYHAKAWYFIPMVFALGPFCPICFKIFTDRRTAYERHLAESELTDDISEHLTEIGRVAISKRIEAASWWREEANVMHKTFLAYYGAVGVLFILALFMNYQILILNNQPLPGRWTPALPLL